MFPTRAVSTLKAASHTLPLASSTQLLNTHQTRTFNQSNRSLVQSIAPANQKSHAMKAALAFSLAAFGLTIASNTASNDSAEHVGTQPKLTLPGLPLPAAEKSKQRKSKKRAETRPALPNPGKFDHTHQEASHLTNSQCFSGARLQAAFTMFPPAQSPDAPHVEKQLVLMPALSMSQDGQSGMLNVRTELGHSHVLEGMVDTATNVIGKYKYIHAPWTLKSNYRFIQQQGEDLSFECDYRGSDFIAQGIIQSSFSEAILSYNQQITQQLSLGAQLHTALPHVTFFNLTARYNNRKGDISTVSFKNGMAILSYFRSAYETPAHPMFPSSKLDLATELRISTNNKQSEFAVGACLQHPTFKYTVMVNNEPTISVLLEQSLGNLGMMFSISGEAKFDGSNEAKFGVGLQMG